MSRIQKTRSETDTGLQDCHLLLAQQPLVALEASTVSSSRYVSQTAKSRRPSTCSKTNGVGGRGGHAGQQGGKLEPRGPDMMATYFVFDGLGWAGRGQQGRRPWPKGPEVLANMGPWANRAARPGGMLGAGVLSVRMGCGGMGGRRGS